MFNKNKDKSDQNKKVEEKKQDVDVKESKTENNKVENFIKIRKEDLESIQKSVSTIFSIVDEEDVKKVEATKDKEVVIKVWNEEKKVYEGDVVTAFLRVITLKTKDEDVKCFDVVKEKEQEYLTGWQRAKADLANLKRRMEAERQDWISFTKQNLVNDFLEVKDNFDSALQFVPENIENDPWMQGVKYIDQQFEKFFSDNKVEIIPVKVGDEFDHNIHEALSSVESEKLKVESSEDGKSDGELKQGESQEEREDHKVTKIFKKGYRLGDKIIRPALISLDKKYVEGEN